MNAQDMSDFWRLYDLKARPAIERACRSVSRSLSEGTMDPDEMISWVHQRVWRMAEASAAPTFHDDPTPEQAVERLTRHARTLARWAHLALMRAHWRRAARQGTIQSELTRAERLAMVSRVESELERDEAVQAKLAEVRESVSHQLRAKLAASWPEAAERRRIALALGATETSDDDLIDRTSSGEMKENTVQQMRSRAQRQIRAILGASKRIAVLALVLSVASFTTNARAVPFDGEQTGGRTPLATLATQTLGVASQTLGVAVQTMDSLRSGEQTGGRGGTKNSRVALDSTRAGEQTGGRKG